MAEELIAKTKATLTGTDGLALDFFTVGYRPTPADSYPVIGRRRRRTGCM